jgi:hypothetical protein
VIQVLKPGYFKTRFFQTSTTNPASSGQGLGGGMRKERLKNSGSRQITLIPVRTASFLITIFCQRAQIGDLTPDKCKESLPE